MGVAGGHCYMGIRRGPRWKKRRAFFGRAAKMPFRHGQHGCRDRRAHGGSLRVLPVRHRAGACQQLGIACDLARFSSHGAAWNLIGIDYIDLVEVGPDVY